MNIHFVDQFIKMLTNLDGLLTKAEAHADAKKTDPNNFANERLIVDMLPLAKQVQIACDNAKICTALLSNTQPPVYEDNEKIMVELHQRIEKTVNYLKTMREADFSNFKKAVYTPKWAGGGSLTGEEYFYQFAIPNFYFHVTTAYAILRKDGVDIGKPSFIGGLNFK